jgi:excisionase family DNA binding protein
MKQHLTAEDIAERLQIPIWSIYEMARAGDLPVLRIGRRIRFREEDIEQWEKEQVERGREEATRKGGS